MCELSRAQFSASSTYTIIRELALAADRSFWTDDQSGCIAIIARIYSLFDDLELGLEPDLFARIVAADTAAWVGHMHRSTKLLGDAFA